MPVKKILVIDDSPTERFFVVDLLSKKGYQTFVAESGEEGIAKAKAEGNPWPERVAKSIFDFQDRWTKYSPYLVVDHQFDFVKK